MARLRLGVALLAAALLGAAPPADEVARGQQAWEAGDAAGALVHWSVALQAARESGDRDAEAELLLRLAAVNRELGRLAVATELLDAAGRSGASPGAVWNARGLVRLAAGDPRGAERLHLRAFEHHRDQGEPRPAADAAVNLGLARMALGRWAEAERALSGADRLFATLDDPGGRGDALIGLGAARARQGRLQEARQALEQATALQRAAGDAQGEADALHDLGLVLQDLGQDEQAEALYLEALATAEVRADVARQGALHLNLGTLDHRAGRLRDAERHYLVAEEAFVAQGQEADAASVALDLALLHPERPEAFVQLVDRARAGRDRRLEALATLNLATVLARTEPARAAEPASRALELSEELELADVRWRAHHLVGVLARANGRDDEGLTHLRAAVDELERRRLALGRGEVGGFLVQHDSVYKALIDALLDRGDAQGAMVYAERLQVAALPVAPQPNDEAAAHYHQLVTQEAFLGEALSTELSRPEADPARAEGLRQELARLRMEFAATVDQLRSNHPDFDLLVRVDPEDLEAVQGDLDPGVVVLQPVLFDDRVVLLVFRRDRVVAHEVEVDGLEVARTTRRLARLNQSADALYDPDLSRRLCDRLGAWLISPIAAELEGAEVLVVSVHGAFRQVPFSLLRHQGRYVAEDLAVVNVTHVGSLRRRARADTSLRLEGPDVLLIGNPDGTLPAAEEEVRAIADHLPGAVVLAGPQGSREALYAQVSGKRAVHLATHGKLDPRRPDRSHLVLEAPDGVLGYREIPGLAPYLDRCRLVVLSACESGLPVQAQAAEEGEVVVSINGLAAQFRRAGVETLVASLWRVDDEGTRWLMEGFYDELADGADVATALQRSQQRMIASDEWSNPWFWAAFVVVGDWR